MLITVPLTTTIIGWQSPVNRSPMLSIKQGLHDYTKHIHVHSMSTNMYARIHAHINMDEDGKYGNKEQPVL